MLVKELIKELQKYDENLIVRVEDIFEGYSADAEISDVSLEQNNSINRLEYICLK